MEKRNKGSQMGDTKKYFKEKKLKLQKLGYQRFFKVNSV